MHEAFNGKRWQQIDCSGLPCPLPGHLPNPGIKPRSPALQADSLLSESSEKPIACQAPLSVRFARQQY